MFKFPIGPILTTPPKPTATSQNYAETTPYQPPLTQQYYQNNASLSHEVTLKKIAFRRSQKSFFCPNNCKIEIYNCIFFKRHYFQKQIMEVFEANYHMIDIIIKILILFALAVALIMVCTKRPIITCRAKGKNIILY